MKQFSYQKYYFLYLSFDTRYLSFTDVYLSFSFVYLPFNCVYLPFSCVYLSFNYVYLPFGCVDLPFNCVYFSFNYVLIIQLCPFIVHAIMPFYSSFNNGFVAFQLFNIDPILIDRLYLSSKSTAEYDRLEGLGMVLCHTRWRQLGRVLSRKGLLDTCVYKGNRFKNTSILDVQTYYKATETLLGTHISLPATHQGSVKVSSKVKHFDCFELIPQKQPLMKILDNSNHAYA